VKKYFRASLHSKMKWRVSIADIRGRRITLTNMRFDGNGYITMNNQLLPGIYIMQVNTADQQYKTKLSVH